MRLYYNVINMGNGPVLLVTEQGYFDKNGSLDDGAGPDYKDMDAALAKAGAEPLGASMYKSGRTRLQDILKNLRADGHVLAAKPAMIADIGKD